MQSPFFPNFYPRDVIVEHLIECTANDTTQCHIEISFVDFLIASSSVMEVSLFWLGDLANGANFMENGLFLFRPLQFYDEYDQMLSRFTGEIFRPPILHVQARVIRILFYGNDGTDAGYRATINYSTKNITNEITSTHCGGLVESFGGTITMMNMTNSSASSFDCIWLIKPPNSYLHLKTHLLVRVDTFENMGTYWARHTNCTFKSSHFIHVISAWVYPRPQSFFHVSFDFRLFMIVFVVFFSHSFRKLNLVYHSINYVALA